MQFSEFYNDSFFTPTPASPSGLALVLRRRRPGRVGSGLGPRNRCLGEMVAIGEVSEMAVLLSNRLCFRAEPEEGHDLFGRESLGEGEPSDLAVNGLGVPLPVMSIAGIAGLPLGLPGLIVSERCLRLTGGLCQQLG